MAEARFLRRYGADRGCLETYLRELRLRSGGREPDRELRVHIKEVEEALAAGKPIRPGAMARYLKNLMPALERI
jgi:predicted NBD/HSP70 family sugar kinase